MQWLWGSLTETAIHDLQEGDVATSNDGTSVIIADDDSMIRGVLRHKLEAIDQIVYQASDGIEALEFASRIQAKLIMLDLLIRTCL